jgi:hypothetical protein
LMVLDDSERGVPVAHCLTNHEDTDSIEIFLQSLQTQLQSLNSRWFLSDDAPAFYNAWKKIFGEVTKKLLCIWHVLRNVNRNIQSYIHDVILARRIKSCFRAVMYAHNYETSRDAVHILRKELNPSLIFLCTWKTTI